MDFDGFSRFVASGRMVDLILIVVVCEAAALIAYHRYTGGGLSAHDALPNLASGACLLLALRFALGGAPWPTIVIAVCASLAAHLYDLSRRWDTKRPVRAIMQK